MITKAKTEIILSGFGIHLGKSGTRLVATQKGKIQFELPASQVDGVYVLTRAAAVTAEAVRAITESGATLAFINRHGRPYGFIVHPEAHSNAELRAIQMQVANNDKGLEIAKAIITGKIRNQATTLRYFSKSRKKSYLEIYKELQDGADRIDKLCGRLSLITGGSGHDQRGQLMGVESEAAALYWSRLRAILPEELNFQRRIRRGAGDAVNSCINYGYGILYTKVFSKITRARLDPYVGFFHTIRSGKTSLLFDTIEMFRQYFVDRPVISWLNKRGKPEFDSSGKLQRKTRGRIASLVLDRHNSRVRYKGKMEVAENVMQVKIRELAKAIKNEISFSALIWPW